MKRENIWNYVSEDLGGQLDAYYLNCWAHAYVRYQSFKLSIIKKCKEL